MPHIGNYRTFLYQDILQRYLERLGYKIDRTLFITDVEDKAIAEAQKERVGLRDLTDRNTKAFVREFRKLRAKEPTHVARSSTSVNQAVQIIETLLKKGYAYWYKGDVYYDALKFKGFGKLYRLDMKRWPREKRRFHKDTYPGNRWNLGDFVLWHGCKEEDEVCWDTPIGRGRPAWNVQDPALALQTRGMQADIYCGGVDNMIRHHDYVIAIAEAVTGKPFARFWLHGEHLFVDGRKMSKTLGNIIYPNDLIERGCEWQHIRFFLINGYYRKKLNFTFAEFKKACDQLNEFRNIVKRIKNVRSVNGDSGRKAKKYIAKLKDEFEVNMNNDLHVRDAFKALFKTVSNLCILADKGKMSFADSRGAIAILKSIDQVLQVIF